MITGSCGPRTRPKKRPPPSPAPAPRATAPASPRPPATARPPARPRSPGPLEEAEGRHVGGGLEQRRLGLAFVEHAQAVQLHGAAGPPAGPRAGSHQQAAAAPRDPGRRGRVSRRFLLRARGPLPVPARGHRPSLAERVRAGGGERRPETRGEGRGAGASARARGRGPAPRSRPGPPPGPPRVRRAAAFLLAFGDEPRSMKGQGGSSLGASATERPRAVRKRLAGQTRAQKMMKRLGRSPRAGSDGGRQRGLVRFRTCSRGRRVAQRGPPGRAAGVSVQVRVRGRPGSPGRVPRQSQGAWPLRPPLLDEVGTGPSRRPSPGEPGHAGTRSQGRAAELFHPSEPPAHTVRGP